MTCRSEATQTDWMRDDPQRLAQAHRQQAAMWLMNPYYTPAERKRRHDHDIEQAERLERQEQAA